MKNLVVFVIVTLCCTTVSAQTFNPRVSKDSLKILTTKMEILKLNIKVLELKVKEAEAETDVEKLRINLLESKGDAAASLEKREENTDRSSRLEDQTKVKKLAKNAERDAKDAKKALDRFDKQKGKIDEIRAEIIAEVRKLTYKKPIIIFDYQ